MSRIYFHTPSDCAEVAGAERAMMGTRIAHIFVEAMGADRTTIKPEGSKWDTLLPENCYLRGNLDNGYFRHNALATWLSVGGEREYLRMPEEFGVERIDLFTLQLNTALAYRSDILTLMARLHGQCEIHTYVEGKNRLWLSNIIEQGRELFTLRSNEGWESVIALLRSRDDEPVVTSYSVCEQFPNHSVAEWTDDCDGDSWHDLPDNEQWDLAISKLREKFGGLEMKPERWLYPDYWFNEKVTAFTIEERFWAEAHRTKDFTAL